MHWPLPSPPALLENLLLHDLRLAVDAGGDNERIVPGIQGLQIVLAEHGRVGHHDGLAEVVAPRDALQHEQEGPWPAEEGGG